MPGYAASARRSAFTTSDRNPSEERSDLRASLVSLLTCFSSVGLRVFTILPYACFYYCRMHDNALPSQVPVRSGQVIKQ